MPKVSEKVYANFCEIIQRCWSDSEREKLLSDLEKIIKKENPGVLGLVEQARQKGINSALAVCAVYYMLSQAYKQQFSLLQRRKVSLPKIEEKIIAKIGDYLDDREWLEQAFNDIRKYNPCIAGHLAAKAADEQNKLDLSHVSEAVALYLAFRAKFNGFDYFPKRK